jgi:hypothetical protein
LLDLRERPGTASKRPRTECLRLGLAGGPVAADDSIREQFSS